MSSYEKYAAIRDSLGLTDYKVAKETGIGTATFSNWKKGKYQPKTDKIQKIADFLGVPVEEINQAPRSKNIIRVYHSALEGTKHRNPAELFAGVELIRPPKEKINNVINEVFDSLPKLTAEQMDLVSDYEMLTDDGKDKLQEYLTDLLEIDKYRKPVEDPEEPEEENVEQTDDEIVEQFQSRFVARNGNKNLTPEQMKAIMDIVDGNTDE